MTRWKVLMENESIIYINKVKDATIKFNLETRLRTCLHVCNQYILDKTKFIGIINQIE